jgi:hypothetical protein
MGNSKDIDRCLSIIHGGVVEKARVEEQQWHSRTQKRKAHRIAQWENGQEIVDLFVPYREVRRATQVILQTINKTLSTFPSDFIKENVL